jgi:hypothetical protein
VRDKKSIQGGSRRPQERRHRIHPVASLLLVGWTSGNSNGGPILNCRCEVSNDKSNRRLGRYSDPESNGEEPHISEGERSDQSAFLFHSPQTSSSRPKRPGPQRAHLLAGVVATDSLIVCCAVERPRISPLPLLVLAIVFVSGYPKASADAGNIESCLRTRLQPLRYVFFCYAHFFNNLFSLGSLSLKTHRERPPLCRRRASPTSGSLLVGGV